MRQYQPPANDNRYVFITATRETAAVAHPALRWSARLIDTALIVGGTVAVSVATQRLVDSNVAAVAAFGTFALLLTLFGALYGWGNGLGQMLCGVRSRRTRDCRHLGAWRGICRYWGVAFSPLLVWGLLSEGDAPMGWHDNVQVTRRRSERPAIS